MDLSQHPRFLRHTYTHSLTLSFYFVIALHNYLPFFSFHFFSSSPDSSFLSLPFLFLSCFGSYAYNMRRKKKVAP